MKKNGFLVVLALALAFAFAACSFGSSGSSDAGQTGSNLTIKWFVSKGVPSNSQGADGDLYLDQDAAVLYVKTGGKWVTAASLRGPSGSGWLFGSGAPAASLGSNGDLYLDTASTMTYRKYNGAWVSMFALQGAAGAAGAAWYTGATDPTPSSPAEAKAGDFYLNTLSTVIWKKAASGSWTSVVILQTTTNPQFIFTPFMGEAANALNETFTAVAYGNGAFVAVGTTGTIIKTTDGRSWNLMTYGDPGMDMSRIARPRSAVGKGFVDNPDPARTISGSLNGIAYGNGIFVTVGNSYQHPVSMQYYGILTSADASSWTPVSISESAYSFTSVTFLNAMFFAVGGLGEVMLWTSTDGTTWVDRTSGPFGTFGSISNVVYGNGKYLAYVTGETRGFITSTNGTDWSLSVALGGGTGTYVTGLASGNGTFVAVGVYQGETSRPAVWTSLDGVAWVLQDLAIPYTTGELQFNGAVYGNGFAAFGYHSITPMSYFIMTSPNGITWSYQTWPSPSIFSGAAWGPLNGGTYAVAIGGS